LANLAIGSGHDSPVCGQIEGHAGITTPTVARIERDEIEPPMHRPRKLARALEVDAAELV
jgi:transcriptional regulator with XRE-family HTH domain